MTDSTADSRAAANFVRTAAAVACLCGCAETVPVSVVEGTGSVAQCIEPRPQLCTQDYRPVCGVVDTGLRCVTTPCDSTELRTYGNACTACSDPEVVAYTEGACDE